RQIVVSDSLIRAILKDAAGIGHNERVLAVLMLEVIENTGFFHEAGSKIEIRFTILNAIFARLIGSSQRPREVDIDRKYLLEYLGDGHVLKNLAIATASQEPERGNHLHLVAEETGFGTALRELADESVDVTASRAIGKLNTDGDSLSDDLG